MYMWNGKREARSERWEVRGEKQRMKEYQDEEWFLSQSWQEAEREADKDFREGNYQVFNSVEELIQDLDSSE